MEAGNVETWSVYTGAEYLQAGLAALSDISIGDAFSALVGVRYDYVDAEGLSGDGIEAGGPVEVVCFSPVCEFDADESDSELLGPRLSLISYRAISLPMSQWQSRAQLLAVLRQIFQHQISPVKRF